jgi:uncharacterized membrane protein (Fun14 family)
VAELEREDPGGEHEVAPTRPTHPGLPTWKKVCLALASISMLLGASGQAYGLLTTPEPTPQVATGGNLLDPSIPLESQESGTETGEPAGAPSWSPVLLRLGFSFFIGFCVGYALRAFLKISLIVTGTVVLAIFVLSYAELVDVNWSELEGHFTAFAGRARDELSDFTAFVRGSLPSTGLAGFGLFAGFRKS